MQLFLYNTFLSSDRQSVGFQNIFELIPSSSFFPLHYYVRWARKLLFQNLGRTDDTFSPLNNTIVFISVRIYIYEIDFTIRDLQAHYQSRRRDTLALRSIFCKITRSSYFVHLINTSQWTLLLQSIQSATIFTLF